MAPKNGMTRRTKVFRCHFSAEFRGEERPSVCFKCEPAWRHLVLNSPSVCSLELSIIRTFGTPSRWCSSDKASWAWLFLTIGYTRAHPLAVEKTWAHVFPRRDLVLENMVSVYISTGRRLYRNWRSFVRNRRALDLLSFVDV